MNCCPAEPLPEPRFGLYVHWPFCQAKCPYCDFNSHVVASIDQGRWADAYRAEISRLGDRTGRRVLETIFLGGGTPSLMSAETVAAVLDAARATWPVANDLEVTLEANPTSVEADRFAAYRAAGVTRISLGVQALDDEALRGLGRLHSAAEGRMALAIARQVFDRVSFDLIYGRQGQSLDSWQTELDVALDMGMDHLSLYQLTIEPGTAFAARQMAGGLKDLPDDDLQADLYEATVERAEAAGLSLYEVSNFARPGSECRHNLIYWSGGDWGGIGPGAHGRLTRDDGRVATEQVSAPGAWLDGVDRFGRAPETWSPLSARDVAVEFLLMGLRRRDGVSCPRLEGMDLPAGFFERVEDLGRDGFLVSADGRLRVTDRGRLVLNSVLQRLLAD